MLRRSLTALSVAFVFSCCGCALHIHRDPEPPPGFRYEPAQPATAPFATFERGPIELSEPLGRSLAHDFVELSFLSGGRNGHPDNLVEGRYFRSREAGRKPLVVVLPIWGTSDYPPQKISTGYARRAGHDAHVVWLYGNAPLFPWDLMSTAATEERFTELARDGAERYRSAVVDLRRLIDWAETQPAIDASRIAVVGFSMSALVTATLLANEPRVSAAILMMGAANFADVFSQCGNRAGEVRDHVLSSFGWSIGQYRDFFASLFDPADPSQFEGRYDPNKILMIDAMFDDCMPESSRAALWEVTGYPARITFLYRHRSAFYSLTPLGLNVSRRQIYRFLDEALFERRR